MPALQVVNFQEKPRQGPNGLERVLEGYSQRDREYREADELKKVYQQYQDQEMNLEQKFQALQTNPRISPTRRVEEVSNLKTQAEINAKQQKIANEQLKNNEKYNEELKKKQQEQELDVKETEFLEDIKDKNLSSLEIYNKALPVIGRKRAKDIATLNRQGGREERLSLKDLTQMYDNELKSEYAALKAAGVDEDKRKPILDNINSIKEKKKADISRFNRGEKDFTPTLFNNHKEEIVTEIVAEENPEIAEIIEKINSKFPAKEWSGKIKVHKPTGLKFKSNGDKWVLTE